MSGFDSRMIFIGIILVLTVLAWIVLDKRKSENLSKQLDEKKKELVAIINDAEQMIEELNHFSEYIVNQMDVKSAEFAAILKKAETKAEKLSESLPEKGDICRNNRSSQHTAERAYTQADKLLVHEQKQQLASSTVSNVKIAENPNFVKNQNKKEKDKVIPLNTRHKEILKLRERGMNETEIARNLNIGKGEIELVLELNKTNLELEG